MQSTYNENGRGNGGFSYILLVAIVALLIIGAFVTYMFNFDSPEAALQDSFRQHPEVEPALDFDNLPEGFTYQSMTLSSFITTYPEYVGILEHYDLYEDEVYIFTADNFYINTAQWGPEFGKLNSHNALAMEQFMQFVYTKYGLEKTESNESEFLIAILSSMRVGNITPTRDFLARHDIQLSGTTLESQLHNLVGLGHLTMQIVNRAVEQNLEQDSLQVQLLLEDVIDRYEVLGITTTGQMADSISALTNRLYTIP